MDIQLISDSGKKHGIEEMEVYMKSTSSTGFKVYEGSVEGYNIEEENALSIRGIYKGKIGEKVAI